MLTATTESAIRALVFLCCREGEEPASPREIAEAVGGSPSYTAKITGLLTKAGIVRARSGAGGGIVLARSPAEITLLDIVQSCQGLVTADYCDAIGSSKSKEVCAFHHAMEELHAATIRTLTRWTLQMLAAKPLPQGTLKENPLCRMATLSESCGSCTKTGYRAVRKPD